MTPEIVLTKEEKSLIYGTLLGDAHLQKRQNSFRLKIEHNIEQKEYVLWKYKKLKRLCKTTQPPKIVTSQKGFKTVLFYTSSGAYLRPIHEAFYKTNRQGRVVKTITEELIERLPSPLDNIDSSVGVLPSPKGVFSETPRQNSLALAVFYMDDGSIRDDCFAGKLATQGFSLAENNLLSKYLLKFNINSTAVKHTKISGQYYLSLPASSFGRMVDLIKPTVSEIECMAYKIKKKNITP